LDAMINNYGQNAFKPDDIKFMKEAIRLASKGLGRTSPNPAVGAVIVREGRIVASGYHKKAGGNHAEVEALSMVDGKGMADDILYVTLEPCNHYGKTPPCTEAIISSGIKNVMVGMPDPNPSVTGGGIGYLRDKGIRVVSGVLEAECRKLNEAFIRHVTTGRPFVIAKSALTLDGWSATSAGDSKWITNEKSRDFVHRMRHRVDGIMTGVGTIIADDPFLTARPKEKRGRDPVRIIVDTHLRIPHNAKVLNHDSIAETIIVVGEHVSRELIKRIEKPGVSVMTCSLREGRIDLKAMIEALGRLPVASLLVEGGAGIMGSMIRHELIDKFYIFKAPRILGGDDGLPMAKGMGPSRMDQSILLRDIEQKRFGDDMLIIGYPEYKKRCKA
jgi:diaminohydroxyphosphoribosylaminopyrimidine deaminase / 5-amino-6-(5-phosphoribosylamino)uracil reductase